MSKRVLFFLLPLTFAFFIISLTYISITNNPLSDTPYYKVNINNASELTSIIENEPWSNNKARITEELYTKKRIDESFIAQSNNLGSILVSFNTHNRSVDDKIIFRLKETGEKNWFYQASYDTNQIQTNVPFPFGFPIIKEAGNKSYTFEIESLAGRPGNSISISKSKKYFYSKYKFTKTDLVNNPFILSQFIVTKVSSQLLFLAISQIATIVFFTFLPILLYGLFLFYKRVVHPAIYPQMQNVKLLIFKKKRLSLLYPLTRDERIKICSIIVCVGFYCAIAYHYIQGGFYMKPFPLNTFLPNWFFGDFFGAFDEWKRLKFTGVGYGLSYFPGTYLIVNLFTLFFTPNVAVFVELSIFIFFLFIFVYKKVKTKSKIMSLQNAFIISFMSYPFLFTFQTANLEMFTFMCVILFLAFYTKRRIVGAFFLGYAISMKVFPGIFLVLLFLEKRYKDIFLTLLFVVIFTLLPLLIFNGGFNQGIGNYISHLEQSQKMYSDLMIISGAGNSYGNSLLNGIRVLFPSLIPSMKPFLFPYEIFISIISLVIIVFLKFFEKTFWKRIAVLVMMLNLFPFTSTDYKLLYIFIPLFYFMNYPQQDRSDAIFIILMSLLLIPKDYFYFDNAPIATFNIVANSSIMLLILLMILLSKLKPSWFDTFLLKKETKHI